jgi:hypothetical protein
LGQELQTLADKAVEHDGHLVATLSRTVLTVQVQIEDQGEALAQWAIECKKGLTNWGAMG